MILMRAFVTGGTGLIGHHVVETLLSHGWEVAVLTRDLERARDLVSRGVRVVQGDVRRPDFGQELVGIDVLFHCAAWYEVGVRNAQVMSDVNVNGTANVFSLARKEVVPRIVYTSTAGLFRGSRASPATEKSSPAATVDDPYVTTKLQAHNLAVKEMSAGLPLTIVAPGGVFGTGDTSQFARSLALLVQGRFRTLPSGFGTNAFTHAADVAEGQLLAATVGRPGETYFLADRVMTLYEFLNEAARAASVDPPRRRVPMSLARLAARISEVRSRSGESTPLITRTALELSSLDVVVDSTKARKELGWSPRPFEDRLRETMVWYVSAYGRRGAPLPVKPSGASDAGPSRRA
jgi:dihydroflavonol-4-reductase